MYSRDDLSTMTTEQLLHLLRAAEAGAESCIRSRFARRAYELRAAEVERWIAVHNARATERIMGGMSEQRLSEIHARLADGSSTVRRDVVCDLLAEVRRLQGEVASLLHGYLPPEPRDAPHVPDASDDFDA